MTAGFNLRNIGRIAGVSALPVGMLILVALMIFPVDTFAAGVMIATASLPVAGNVFMLAQHYNVAPSRVSAAILFSTAGSILTVPLVIAWVTGH